VKILVISLSGIGDTLITTPFLHELRLQYPEATIDVLVLWPGSRGLLDGNPYINQVYQKNLITDSFWSSLGYLRNLGRQRYDISINTHTQGRIHYRLVARLIAAPLRLSHQYENHGLWDRLLVNRTLPQDYSIHSVENNARLLSLLHRSPRLLEPDLEIFLSDQEKEEALHFMDQPDLRHKKRLGLHVGSGSTKNLALKRWPLSHYIQLLKELTSTHSNLAVLLLGGPEETSAHQQIQKEIPQAPLWIPPTKNLRQAGALLRHCHAFLSVDTSLMHLAAAMKTPGQIVIEAPTLNPTNVPWKNPYRLVANPCVNGRNLEYYRYDGKPIKGSRNELLQCMASVTVENVRKIVEETLFP